jgi:phage-related protein
VEFFEVPRKMIWLGDTRKNIREFPEKVKDDLGEELTALQRGEMPPHAKPFKGVGSGVVEIALKHDKEAYRAIQALTIGDRIYVLHVFQKKSKAGISTPQKDVDLIKQRYKEAVQIEKERKP